MVSLARIAITQSVSGKKMSVTLGTSYLVSDKIIITNFIIVWDLQNDTSVAQGSQLYLQK